MLSDVSVVSRRFQRYFFEGAACMEISKRDWKLFREKISEWQESYMERLSQEYIELLSGNGSASDRFWALEERIKQDRSKPGVLVEMTKSKVIWNIIALIQDGTITMNDLNDFSDDLKDAVSFFLNH